MHDMCRYNMASQQNSIKQNTWDTYRHHGGVGVGVGVGPVAPVANGEGSVDACWELRCTKDYFQCIVSMMQLKCED